MSKLDLASAKKKILFGKDNIIVQKFIAGIKGGRTLVVDPSAYPLSVVYAGLPVIVKDSVYKPMPVKQSGEEVPTAAVSSQTAGSAIVGTVYEGVTAETSGAVKCALANGTVVYLAASAATGTAAEDKTYYTKDTTNKTFVGDVDEDGDPVYVLDTLPTGYEYAGILYKSILASKPAASIMTIGQVNEEALYFSVSGIKSAFLAACPHIEFIKDEEA